MTTFFNDSQLGAVLDYASVIAVLDEAYADLAKGQAAILHRQRCSVGEGAAAIKFSSMGGVWRTRSAAATKSYSTVGGQFSFLISLFDTAANKPLAVMEAGEITRFRTSAQSALVASRLKPARVGKVALFGAGLQGRAQVEALSQRIVFDELAIVDPQISQLPSIKLKGETRMVVCDAQTAVQDADIVITATRSQQSVFDGNWLKGDALVIAIGISAATGRELDTRTFDRASRVIVEWKPQSMQEAGDLLAWLRDLPTQVDKIVDLPALYAQDWPVASGIQVFKSVGTGLADTAAAWLAWHRLQTGD